MKVNSVFKYTKYSQKWDLGLGGLTLEHRHWLATILFFNPTDLRLYERSFLRPF